MTEERRKELEERRARRKMVEEGAVARGELVDGTRVIEQAAKPQAQIGREPVMVAAGPTVGQRKASAKRKATRLV